ncbi:hypothetical protein [Microbulbifer halophilus]|uniref:Uncharacterized protein n=1 Tax=Microbulbifer halophilus TaxID=453963 RepID=A0ABW5E9M0_9GAMM|nr:hypothetical protein [Microbulbifer halophilus]MCW8126505.1 hypothetical protein [Microbulbifer halophilus]
MRHPAKHWLFTLLCVAAISAPTVAQDESGESEKEDTGETTEPVKVAQAKAGDEDKKASTDADDYEASEEISEDLSVSYPVDI